jgi:AcrR family transcriptional regulator
MPKNLSETASRKKGEAAALADSPWPSVARREQQRQAKRYAVLQAAAQLFNERGFHDTSLDDIAAQLNVSKPTLYYYVKNKEQILIECMEEALKLTLEKIELSRQGGSTALQQLHDCMYVFGIIATEPFGACLVRIGDEVLSPEARQELRRMKSEINKQFRRLVEMGIQEGALAPCDATVMAFSIQGAIGWLARWYQPGGKYAPAEVVQRTVDGLLQGAICRHAPPAKARRSRAKAANANPAAPLVVAKAPAKRGKASAEEAPKRAPRRKA